ncbi:MAG: hypothetical protein OSJ63_05525 [Bacilli bacterium]|nr:hypothetical protein [Bacilli bacterium]
MNNKPIFYDTRFRHNNPKSYSRDITIENIYHCPKCNNLIWKKKFYKIKNVHIVI